MKRFRGYLANTVRQPVGPPGGAVGAAAKLRWDLLMLCLAVMVLTYVWRFQSIFSPIAKLQLTTLATLGAYGLYVLNGDARRRLSHLKQPIVILMLCIFGMMLLSVPGSLWPGGSFAFIKDFIKTLVFALLLAAGVRAFADVERLAAVHVLGAMVYSAMVLRGTGVDPLGRARGIGGYDSNDYSLLLVCTLPLTAYFLATAKTTLRKILAGVAILALTLAIVKGGSRSGFVGLIAVFGYMLIAYSALPKKFRIGAVIVSLVGLMFVANESYWQRMSTLLNPSQDYNWSGNAYLGRMQIWKRGLSYMWQRPLLGVGIGRFGTAEGRLSERAQGPDYGPGLRWTSPHNSFVEIGAELGVPGLLLFIALILYTLRAMLRLGRSPPGVSGRRDPQAAMAQAMVAVMIGYVVVGFFISQAYSYYLYSLLGIMVGLVKVGGVGRAQPARARRRRAPQPAPRSAPALAAGPVKGRRRLLTGNR